MSIQAMNISIKNNALLLNKRRRRRRWSLVSQNQQKKHRQTPKIGAKELRNIRRRIQEEEQIRALKVITVTAVLSLIVISALIYVLIN